MWTYYLYALVQVYKHSHLVCYSVVWKLLWYR